MSDGYSRVVSAAERLKGSVVVTPLLNSHTLDELLGFNLFLKAENLQKTGSFKFRGAYNKLSLFSEVERAKGVVAPSSGNHGHAVAFAAASFQIQVTILMPVDAPEVKIKSTRSYGAEVRFYDRMLDDRLQMASDITATTGALFVSSSDDLDIIAGQGTVALEFLEQLASVSSTSCRSYDASAPIGSGCHILGPPPVLLPHAIFGSCCGGGLVSGISDVCEVLSPDTIIYAVEPEGFDDMKRSLETGKLQSNNDAACTGGDDTASSSSSAGSMSLSSICDSLLSSNPGMLPLEALKRRGCDVIKGAVVSDGDVKYAMLIAHEYFQLVLEPGGAAALAAVLNSNMKCKLAGQVVVAVASGGNIDQDRFINLLLACENRYSHDDDNDYNFQPVRWVCLFVWCSHSFDVYFFIV